MQKNSLFNFKVILGIIILAGLLLCATVVTIIYFYPSVSSNGPASPAMALTIIPAFTSTPLYQSPTPPPIPPMPESSNTPAPGEIALNAYVQISGTGGDGLRLRASPGISSDPLFLGNESEVFLVVDGPRQADGYNWWYLKAPYDETRSGWAVANFLAYVPSP
jgi:hypothetical protein